MSAWAFGSPSSSADCCQHLARNLITYATAAASGACRDGSSHPQQDGIEIATGPVEDEPCHGRTEQRRHAHRGVEIAEHRSDMASSKQIGRDGRIKTDAAAFGRRPCFRKPSQ